MLQKRQIEAVIFDLDGVLVQSERVSWKTWLDFLQEFGKEMGDDDYRSLIGTHNSAEFIRTRLNLPLSAEEISQDHQRRVLEAIEHGVPVTKGTEALLADLSSRSLPLAVASNSHRHYVLRVLELTGLAQYFQAVVTRDDVPLGKPAPDVYLEAAARLGIPAKDCMAVEDSPVGLEAAVAAEMVSIAIPNPDLQEMDFEIAQYKFESIISLHNALSSLF
ncbi:MAG: HAD family phosphatase [Anaerolineales bacterium]|nr:HAD family phosphatase [Anaerolineales bacterium]